MIILVKWFRSFKRFVVGFIAYYFAYKVCLYVENGWFEKRKF